MRTKFKKIGALVISFFFVIAVALGPALISVRAVVSGATVVAAVCFAALAGWGVVTIANGLTAPDLDAWMVEELGLWGTENNTTYDQLIPESGIGINAFGDFILDPAASIGVATFSAWLVDKYGVTSGSTVDIMTPHYVLAELPVGQTVTIGAYSNGYVYANSQTNSHYKLCFVREKTTGASRDYYRPMLMIAEQYAPTNNQLVDIWWTGSYAKNVTMKVRKDGNAYYNGYYYNFNTTTSGAYLYSPYGITGIPLYDTPADAIDGAGQVVGGSLSLSGDTNITVPDDPVASDTNVSWGGSTGMTVQSAADTILNQVVDNSLNVTITQTGEGVETPEQTWPDVDRPIGVEGLAQVFPFCIPFDIVDFLQLLEAERQTPVFDFEIVIPPLNIDEHVILDFTMFNDLAAMVRTAELFLFVIGLAVVTRMIFAKG